MKRLYRVYKPVLHYEIAEVEAESTQEALEMSTELDYTDSVHCSETLKGNIDDEVLQHVETWAWTEDDPLDPLTVDDRKHMLDAMSGLMTLHNTVLLGKPSSEELRTEICTILDHFDCLDRD